MNAKTKNERGDGMDSPGVVTAWRHGYEWRVNAACVDEHLLEVLIDPEDLMGPPSESLKPAFKDHVTYVVRRQCPGLGRNVVVKRYLPKNPLHGLRNVFRGAPAARAFTRAAELLEAGIATPKPIAWTETRRTWLTRPSYLITEEASDATSLRALRQRTDQPAMQRRLARALGELMGRLHHEGWSHSDPSLSNFLVQCWESSKPEIILIDLDALRKGRHVTLASVSGDLKKLLSRIPMTFREQCWFFAAHQRKAKLAESTRRLMSELGIKEAGAFSRRARSGGSSG